MSFRYSLENRSGIDFLRFIDDTSDTLLELIPSMGGTVNRLRISGHELLCHDTDEELLQDLTVNAWFRGRILFPFNDMIPEGEYIFEFQKYNFDINIEDENFSLHGFLYKNAMSVKKQSVTDSYASVVLRFETNSGQVRGYPFAVMLDITYTITKNDFKISFDIANKGHSNTPLALGWHPYFKISESGIDDLVLNINSSNIVELNDGVPTGSLKECEACGLNFSGGNKIGSTELDTGFVAPEDGVTTLASSDLEIRLIQDRKFFNFVQTYTPEDRQSIAIEPISAAVNSFNHHHLGLKVLTPGENLSTFCMVELFRKK